MSIVFRGRHAYGSHCDRHLNCLSYFHSRFVSATGENKFETGVSLMEVHPQNQFIKRIGRLCRVFMSFVERSLNASFLCKIIYVRKHANKVLLSSRHKRLFEHSRFPARKFFFSSNSKSNRNVCYCPRSTGVTSCKSRKKLVTMTFVFWWLFFSL